MRPRVGELPGDVEAMSDSPYSDFVAEGVRAVAEAREALMGVHPRAGDTARSAWA